MSRLVGNRGRRGRHNDGLTPVEDKDIQEIEYDSQNINNTVKKYLRRRDKSVDGNRDYVNDKHEYIVKLEVSHDNMFTNQFISFPNATIDEDLIFEMISKSAVNLYAELKSDKEKNAQKGPSDNMQLNIVEIGYHKRMIDGKSTPVEVYREKYSATYQINPCGGKRQVHIRRNNKQYFENLNQITRNDGTISYPTLTSNVDFVSTSSSVIENELVAIMSQVPRIQILQKEIQDITKTLSDLRSQ